MNIKVLASGSKGNAYIISDGVTSLLLDAGIAVSSIQHKCGCWLSDIDGCLITHSHGDHAKAAASIARMGIDIYTSQGTIDACGFTGHRIHAVAPLKKFLVNTLEIIPFDVEHDAPEPLGFRVHSNQTGENLLYFTDTYYLKYCFNGMHYIMAECNYSKQILDSNIGSGTIDSFRAYRLIESHMSLETLKKTLKSMDLHLLQQIYLLHLSDANSDEGLFKREIQSLTGAEVYVC